MNVNEKIFYIDFKFIRMCYPNKVDTTICRSFGVLKEYKDKFYALDEINEIISILIKKIPYVENSMDIFLSVKYKEYNIISTHYNIYFRNYWYKEQNKTNEEIKFIYPDKE